MKSVRNIGVVVLALMAIGSFSFAADSGGLSGEAIEKIRPGAKLCRIDEAARSCIAGFGYGLRISSVGDR